MYPNPFHYLKTKNRKTPLGKAHVMTMIKKNLNLKRAMVDSNI
jgi:hypothetical protein